jgi:hypothetical protein
LDAILEDVEWKGVMEIRVVDECRFVFLSRDLAGAEEVVGLEREVRAWRKR